MFRYWQCLTRPEKIPNVIARHEQQQIAQLWLCFVAQQALSVWRCSLLTTKLHENMWATLVNTVRTSSRHPKPKPHPRRAQLSR